MYGRVYPIRELEAGDITPDLCGKTVGKLTFDEVSTDIVFFRLVLEDAEGRALGRNAYWHNKRDYQNYTALNTLGKAALEIKTTLIESENRNELEVTIKNTGDVPAVQTAVRLKTREGYDILPVFWSDNYVTVMPGETRTLIAEYDAKRYPEEPEIIVDGWNV